MQVKNESGTVTPKILADLNDADRERLLDNHPIREREYIMPTPMMGRAYAVIRERVWARRTGAVFYAAPRTGKTRCAFATKDHLMGEFPKLHITLLSARRSVRPTETHMFRMILEAEHHALSSRANADVLFENTVADIAIKTKSKGGGQYVLLIDEMQNLNHSDLQQLVSLHNALELQKIKMTTISFAQPEILHRRTALLASNDRQIIARFLSEPMHYNGCSSVGDLRRILQTFDELSEFPEDSGWSYTRFFFPKAFEHGFRLQAWAETLWQSLSRAASAGGTGSIPMEHTCLSIENLLLSTRHQDCSNFQLDTSDIDAAVDSSQLASFNAVMEGQG